jgi:hypothetical protein
MLRPSTGVPTAAPYPAAVKVARWLEGNPFPGAARPSTGTRTIAPYPPPFGCPRNDGSAAVGHTPVLSRSGLSGTSVCPQPRVPIITRRLPGATARIPVDGPTNLNNRKPDGGKGLPVPSDAADLCMDAHRSRSAGCTGAIQTEPQGGATGCCDRPDRAGRESGRDAGATENRG